MQAGAGTVDGSIVTLKYYYNDITIDVGDSVKWTPVGDAHTVSFLSGAPAPSPVDPQATAPSGGTIYDGTSVVSSGLIVPAAPDAPAQGGLPSSYPLTFTAPGTFHCECLIHPGMVGTVTVQPAGTPYPYTQAQYDETVPRDAATDLASGVALVDAFHTTTSNAGGKTDYGISAGLGNGFASTMRFTPSTLVINAGDSVTWTNSDPIQPHTVTFAGADGKTPEFPSPEAVQPAGGSSYDGSTFTNSGLLAGPPGAPSNQPYTLTFPKPGIYTYHCLIHDELGMVGTIIVR